MKIMECLFTTGATSVCTDVCINTMTWKNVWSFPTSPNRTSCEVKVSLKVFNIFLKE